MRIVRAAAAWLAILAVPTPATAATEVWVIAYDEKQSGTMIRTTGRRDLPLLGLLVPIEMRERYEGRQNNSIIEGRATYGRFRQFQVNTDETFLIKK